jgi:DMSO/TMAO reductase YedYZ molybdopterin-dependent catalytic subunit
MDELQIDQTSLRFEDLARLPEPEQVADVGSFVPGRAGRAVRLSALLNRAGVSEPARFLHIQSKDPSFAVSLPVDEAKGALVVYALGDAPLPKSKGGPFRLLVPGHADECVHVKQLARIELSDAPGRDTRPKDDAEHAKLHQKKKST